MEWEYQQNAENIESTHLFCLLVVETNTESRVEQYLNFIAIGIFRL